ncbi:MAG: FkbM family methyltransferase [Hyphomicrobiales bacterium]
MNRTILHRAFTKLIGRLSAYDMLPAYEYVQNVVEWHLNSYIGKNDRNDVKSFYIVGGYIGEEIPFLLQRYPFARIRVFEASHRYQEKLEERFANVDRVSIVKEAVSDEVGTAVFHETNSAGSGSLPRLGRSHLIPKSCAAEKFMVTTTTLDSVSGPEQIDCLWIDVQGAELMSSKEVRTLSRTKSVFTEVSVRSNLYQGGVTLNELKDFLAPYGFQIVLLGLDRDNLTGNALFVRQEYDNHI